MEEEEDEEAEEEEEENEGQVWQRAEQVYLLPALFDPLLWQHILISYNISALMWAFSIKIS